jgi:lipopolysaccharide export system permease protein
MDFGVYDVNLDIESSLAEEKKARTKTSAEMTFSEIAEKLRAISLKATDSRELILELNRKIAVPFACLVFGILGVPLGIRSHRAVKSRGFTVGLFTVLIYYLLRIGGEALVETGRLSPFIGSWAPNVIFLTVGIYLLIRTAQDKAIDISSFTAFLKKLIPGGEQKR